MRWGYSDARGAPPRTQRLWQPRAGEVRLSRGGLGVQRWGLKAVGRGAAEPVNALDPLAGENRRVRVVTVE